MKLDEIVRGLNEKLDELEKDEKIGSIATYINESWEQKANFMQYLLNRYYLKSTNNEKETPMRNYLYGAAAVTAGFAIISYALLKMQPINDAISVFLAGYLSSLTAIEIRESKNFKHIKNSLEYAIKNDNFKQDLKDFYERIKE